MLETLLPLGSLKNNGIFYFYGRPVHWCWLWLWIHFTLQITCLTLKVPGEWQAITPNVIATGAISTRPSLSESKLGTSASPHITPLQIFHVELCNLICESLGKLGQERVRSLSRGRNARNSKLVYLKRNPMGLILKLSPACYGYNLIILDIVFWVRNHQCILNW